MCHFAGLGCIVEILKNLEKTKGMHENVLEFENWYKISGICTSEGVQAAYVAKISPLSLVSLLFSQIYDVVL